MVTSDKCPALDTRVRVTKEVQKEVIEQKLVTDVVPKAVTVQKRITRVVPKEVTEQKEVTVTVAKQIQTSSVVYVNKTVNVTKMVPVVTQIEVTTSTRSEHPAAVMVLLDGSTSLIEKTDGWPSVVKGDGMGSWRKEKQVAIELISAMQKDLTKLQVGMVQFSGYPGNTKPQDSLLGGEWANATENCTSWGTNGLVRGLPAVQACPGQYSLYQVPLSANLPQVQVQIDKQTLMEGKQIYRLVMSRLFTLV